MKIIRLEGFVGWEIYNAMLVRQLPTDPNEPVHIFVDSNGGDAFEGFAMFNTLSKRSNVTVEIGARAISAASYLPFAADKVLVSKISTWMAHNAQSFAYGDRHEMGRAFKLLNGVDGIMVDVYDGEIKGLKRADIIARMNEEFWLFGGQSIIDAGIADEMGGSDEVQEEELKEVNASEMVENFRAVFNEKMSHRPDKPRDWRALNVIIDGFTKTSSSEQPEENEGEEVTEVKDSDKNKTTETPTSLAEALAAKDAENKVAIDVALKGAVTNEQARILKLLNLGGVVVSETITKAIAENMSQGDYAIAQLEANKAKTAPANADGIAVDPAATPDAVVKRLPEKAEVDTATNLGTEIYEAHLKAKSTK